VVQSIRPWHSTGHYIFPIDGHKTDKLGKIMKNIWVEVDAFSTGAQISNLSWERYQNKEKSMQLGAFSISLAVKDIIASKTFYEKFGFKVFGGDISQNWLIMKNGDTIIGLFQGMFEKNILTFNPGWDSNAQKLESFMDVRELQRQLKAQGLEFVTEADETTAGPASFIAEDPDGNPILFDQHV
jgi:catechol 2,3-dioxygenase-like lactoylglutathione lyase family enzyme